jgi:hypothetical protein
MCTYISNMAEVIGAGKGAEGWFRVTEATIGYDHPTFADADHAILIDFTSHDAGLSARVAVELDLESGRALLETLSETIRAAEAAGF